MEKELNSGTKRHAWRRSAIALAAIAGFALGSLQPGLAQDEQDDVPATGLSDLTRNPYESQGHLRTPHEEVESRFREIRERQSRKPEIAGAMLFMRAANQFDEIARGPLVDDTVRWFRNNEDAGKRVWALVEIYRNKNPQLADNIDLVKREIRDKLEVKPERELDWLDF